MRGIAQPPGSIGRASPAVQVAPVGRTDRRKPVASAVAAILLVVIAITKPWGALTIEPPGPAVPAVAAVGSGAVATSAARATPTVTPFPSPVGDQIPCLAPAGWRLTTLEVGPLGRSRSWIVVTPADVAGPLDPIASLDLRSGGVLALGFCGPDASAAPSSSEIIGAWRVTSVGPGTQAAAAPLRLTAVPRVGSGQDAVWATLYLPPKAGAAPLGAAANPEVAGWPSGHYVFEVADHVTPPVWFALDLQVST